MHKVLTEQQRARGVGAVLVVSLCALPVSLSLLAVTVYLRLVVDEELDLVQGMDTATLPYFLAVTGTINFMANLLLLSAMARTHRPSSRDKAGIKMLRVSIIVTLVTTGLIFSASLFCFIQMALLPGMFEAGLQEALRQYGRVGHVKVRVDLLQMEYRCCGDSGYRDWFSVPWVPRDILIADPKDVQAQLAEGAEYTNDDVPFSCCDPACPRPCIHHHVVVDHLHYAYDHRANTTLYTAGCRHALMDFFGHTLLKHLGLTLLALTFLQLLCLAVSRMLQTSMYRALKAGDLTAASVGYLFKLPKDKAHRKDEETGREKKPLMKGGKSDRKASTSGHAPTTDTDGETTTEEPTSGAQLRGRGRAVQRLPGHGHGRGPPVRERAP